MAGEISTNKIKSLDDLDKNIKNQFDAQRKRLANIKLLKSEKGHDISLPQFNFFTIVVYLIGNEREDALTLQLAGVINKKLIDKRKGKLNFDKRKQLVLIFHENNIKQLDNEQMLKSVFVNDSIIDMNIKEMDVTCMQQRIDLFHKDEGYAPGQCGLILIMPEDGKRKEVQEKLNFLSMVKYNEYPRFLESSYIGIAI